MFGFLFVKELKLLFSSKPFIAVSATVGLLLLLSFGTGLQQYKVNKAHYEQSVSQHQQQLEQSQYWQTVQQEVFLPPQTLSIFVSGLSNDTGRKIPLTRSREIYAQDTRYNDSPLLAVFRTIDLEFMFSVLLPLFALVFTYDSVNGERESGTLALVFSNAVGRAPFILSKITGKATGLIIPIVIPVLFFVLYLPIAQIQLTSEELIRLGLFISAGIVHFFIYLIIGLICSILIRSSSVSFLIVLVIWIFSVFIIPRASVLLAARSVEVPNADAILAQKNRYRMQLFDEDRPKLSEFKPTQTEDMQAAMTEFQKLMSKMGEERDNKVKAFAEKLEIELLNKQNQRDQLALSFSKFSPTAVFYELVTETAFTGIDLGTQFLSQAKAYKNQFDAFITQKTGTATTGMVFIVSDSDEPPKLDFSEMPVFEFKTPSLVNQLPDIFGLMGFLFVYLTAGFLAALLSFLRTDIR